MKNKNPRTGQNTIEEYGRANEYSFLYFSSHIKFRGGELCQM